MRITYIDHSGFLAETEKTVLLFDIVKGTLPPLSTDKTLFIFVSHAHGDHYGRRIYEIAQEAKKGGAPEVKLILSDDISRRDLPAALSGDTVYLGAHETYTHPLLRVETLRSNDQGVAYLVTVAEPSGAAAADADSGIRLYYAGDLNAWYWDGDEEDLALIGAYHEELARIRGRHFDAAFIPVDPRLGDHCTQGVTDFSDACEADTVVPMHFFGDLSVVGKAVAKKDKHPCLARILPVKAPGDSFVLKREALS